MASSGPDPSPRPRCGPYTILEELGRGAQGSVWHGRRTEPWPLEVALKRLPPHAGLTEARAAARLRHDHVVHLVDLLEVGPDDRPPRGWSVGDRVLVLELCRGGTLRDHAPKRLSDGIGVLDTLLDALAHVHAHGLVHRDVKPSNLILAGGADLRPGWKLADLGIAVAVDGAGPAAGTPAYVAPEVLMGQRASPASDLYAVGCVAYQLATGRVPFEGSTDELVRAHLSREPLPPPDVPAPLSGWILSLLRKDPSRRPPSAAAARWALRRVAIGDEALPTHTPAPDLTLTAEELGLERRPPQAAHAVVEDPGPPPLPPAPPATAPLPRALRLPSSGASLLAWRTVPMAGRDDLQAWLWSQLDAALDGPGAAVALVGPREVGVSALVQWLRQAAATAGVPVHGGSEAPSRGLWLDPAHPVPPGVLGLREGPWPGAEAREVAPLSDDAIAALVEELMGADPTLAEEVIRRADGHAGRAHRLLVHWAHTGCLEAGPGGYVLTEARPLSPPVEASPAVQLAALLGPRPSPDTWARACAIAEVAAPGPLPQLTVGERDAVLAGITDGLRLSRAAAAVTEDPGERGRHLARAERWDEAASSLAEGVARANLAGHLRRALALSALHERCLDASGAGPRDPRRLGGLLDRASSLLRARRAEEASDRIAQVLEVLGAGTDLAEVRGRALLLSSVLHREGGRFDEAARAATAALALEPTGSARVRVVLALGHAQRLSGRLDAAAETFRSGLADANPEGGAWLRLALSGVAATAGDQPRATREAALARRAFAQAGATAGEAQALNALAESLRHEGRLAEAEDHYREALDILASQGHGKVATVTLNLAMVQLRRGAWVEARQTLRDALPLLERGRAAELCAAAELGLAWCARELGDAAGAAAHRARAIRWRPLDQLRDPDARWLADRVGG